MKEYLSSPPPCGPCTRLRVALGLLCGLRRHDLRAARSFADLMWADHALPVRLARLTGWAFRQMFGAIP